MQPTFYGVKSHLLSLRVSYTLRKVPVRFCFNLCLVRLKQKFHFNFHLVDSLFYILTSLLITISIPNQSPTVVSTSEISIKMFITTFTQRTLSPLRFTTKKKEVKSYSFVTYSLILIFFSLTTVLKGHVRNRSYWILRPNIKVSHYTFFSSYLFLTPLFPLV